MAELKPKTATRWRVAVSQRRLPGSATSSARDALDAEWSDWFCTNAEWAQFVPMPNFSEPVRAMSWLADWEINALVLTGGEDIGSSPVRDELELGLLRLARAQGWPVLGVCRGMQMLHKESGGELIPIDGHVAHTHRVQTPLRVDVVNSWHRWGVRVLADGWQAMALAPDGSVEAMRHQHLPWLGLMWHPERQQGGVELTQPWVRQIFPIADF